MKHALCPVLTSARSHTFGTSVAVFSAQSSARAPSRLRCCLLLPAARRRGRGATASSAPRTRRTSGAGAALVTRRNSCAPRTHTGNACPTRTTPTCAAHGFALIAHTYRLHRLQRAVPETRPPLAARLTARLSACALPLHTKPRASASIQAARLVEQLLLNVAGVELQLLPVVGAVRLHAHGLGGRRVRQRAHAHPRALRQALPPGQRRRHLQRLAARGSARPRDVPHRGVAVRLRQAACTGKQRKSTEVQGTAGRWGLWTPATQEQHLAARQVGAPARAAWAPAPAAGGL